MEPDREALPIPTRAQGLRAERPNRQVCEAVLYRERVGCPWRDLPGSFGPWQTGDAPAAGPLLAHVLEDEQVQALGADRAYDSDAIRAALAAAGKEAVIPPKANRRVPPPYDRAKYRQRNRIERLFNRLKQFRAVATRYDKLDVMFLGTILAALTLIHLR